MSDKVKTNHLRRLAQRAGLRIATLRTDAGRVYAVIDGSNIVALCIGHSATAQQLAKAAAVGSNG